MNPDFGKIRQTLERLDKQFIFVIISGAHLYGFESFNSDLDIRGCHLPNLGEILRYFNSSDTFESLLQDTKLWPEEIDIVSHSLLKHLHLMAKQPNGYLLEQIFSSLIIQTSPIHQKLQELAKLTICKELKYHYLGFFRNQERLMSKENKQVKLILYQVRIICSAVLVARNGKIEANLIETNKEVKIFDQLKIQELVEIKKSGEKNNFPNSSLKKYWQRALQENFGLIETEFDRSSLPNFDKHKLESQINIFLNQLIHLKYEY